MWVARSAATAGTEDRRCGTPPVSRVAAVVSRAAEATPPAHFRPQCAVRPTGPLGRRRPALVHPSSSLSRAWTVSTAWSGRCSRTHREATPRGVNSGLIQAAPGRSPAGRSAGVAAKSLIVHCAGVRRRATRSPTSAVPHMRTAFAVTNRGSDQERGRPGHPCSPSNGERPRPPAPSHRAGARRTVHRVDPGDRRTSRLRPAPGAGGLMSSLPSLGDCRGRAVNHRRGRRPAVDRPGSSGRARADCRREGGRGDPTRQRPQSGVRSPTVGARA
jgi:hypothetical protein